MWDQIRTNRTRSRVVLVTMGILLVATGMALGSMFGGGSQGALLLGGLVALVVWLVLWLVAATQGDQIFLQMTGARQIQKSQHPVLFNVVEEMTIASGMGKMPDVYIVEDPSPNAFATGRRRDKTAVAVTTGLLELLNRDELQGVVAHEIGHIRNRDVALMTTAGVMVGSIAILAAVGRRALWYGGGHRRSRSDNGQGGGILVIVCIGLLILAPLFAQMVYFALSRKREYLADASGAMFTRYPEGLASALEKMSELSRPMANTNEVTAAMFTVSPTKVNAMTSTHPPILDRIRVLRGMGGRADFGAYEKAFKSVKRGSVVGARTLQSAQEVEVRAAHKPDDLGGQAARHRRASNAFLQASGYREKSCGSCGATVRIPPEFTRPLKTCPRCRGAFG